MVVDFVWQHKVFICSVLFIRSNEKSIHHFIYIYLWLRKRLAGIVFIIVYTKIVTEWMAEKRSLVCTNSTSIRLKMSNEEKHFYPIHSRPSVSWHCCVVLFERLPRIRYALILSLYISFSFYVFMSVNVLIGCVYVFWLTYCTQTDKYSNAN